MIEIAVSYSDNLVMYFHKKIHVFTKSTSLFIKTYCNIYWHNFIFFKSWDFLTIYKTKTINLPQSVVSVVTSINKLTDIWQISSYSPPLRCGIILCTSIVGKNIYNIFYSCSVCFNNDGSKWLFDCSMLHVCYPWGIKDVWIQG